jgi:hypothetical protein
MIGGFEFEQSTQTNKLNNRELLCDTKLKYNYFKDKIVWTL